MNSSSHNILRKQRGLCALLLVSLPGLGLPAQQKSLSQLQRPSCAPTRLAKTGSIRVDGSFIEKEWAQAAELGALTQVDPIEGARPSKPTRVRLLYDDRFLYLAIECTDDPKLVRARLMQRDQALDPDDRVEFWIDTFNDQRFAFWFQIGAAGAKGDALLSDAGNRFNKSWDGIWYGRVQRTRRGWQAEIGIPFQTLAFREGGGDWGFNLVRYRKANDEEDRWALPLVAYRNFDLTVGGKLTGLTGMTQGMGIDVVPYAKGRLTRERLADDDYHRLGDVGGDINYRITPALNMRLTFNTDFAETEVDDRQINLTRFPLFFPEKRDFFLEDAGQFEFGPSERGSNTLIPFFSRRIGRDDSGDEIDIIAGAKLTGRVGDLNIGALQVVQDAHRDQSEKGLGVVRLSYNLGGEDSVGMIVTGGQPVDSGEAWTGGVDFRFGDSAAFGPGAGYSVWGYWLGTAVEGPGGDGDAFGFRADYESAEWNHRFVVNRIDDELRPEIGFVRRTGIADYRLRSGYTWRNQEKDAFLRRFETSVEPVIVTTDEGSKDTWEVEVRWFELVFGSDDRIEFESERGFERLRSDFEISDGVIIPPGDYYTTRHEVAIRTAERRMFNVRTSLEWGDFLSGNITTWRVAPTLLLNKYVQISGNYRDDNVNLREGDFTNRIVEGRLDLQFSPFVSWRNLIQYDNDSDFLTVQSRFRWILQPGSDLFLLGLYGWSKDPNDDALRPDTQDITVKLVYTFRF